MSIITKREIESLYRQYHNPQYLGLDPLGCVRRFEDSENREVVGLFASALAYGRVETIVRNINTLIDDVMGRDPVSFVKGTSYREKREALDGFKHRFNDGDDIAALLEAVNAVTRRYGSLGSCFSDCLARSGGQFKGALTLFTDELKGVLTQGSATRCALRPSFEYLIPSPTRGSACKRLVLYLRWMVRKDDGIDLGVWKGVPASILIIPVDTHVARITKYYGLTSRTSADWKMAEEITESLRKFDPEDPVRFDFSLCHAGMVDFRAR
ncbi:MAG: TIGR02757 family protein [Chitinispirillales bacterium]|jgi:uncharacterized protein (TIGR02757 family)|nr:TIGR02757 family protein [Chitinispirillales bacterium]